MLLLVALGASIWSKSIGSTIDSTVKSAQSDGLGTPPCKKETNKNNNICTTSRNVLLSKIKNNFKPRILG
jgi:hypothetical protein